MKKDLPKTVQPLSTAERLGQVWGGVFVFTIVTLVTVLVGKACFFAAE